MLLYPLPAFLTPFPRTFIIKGNANNGRNLPSCPFPVIAFINEEEIGCVNEETVYVINEAAIDAIRTPRNTPSCFFISCLTASVAPLINRPVFSSDSTILIISFVFS